MAQQQELNWLEFQKKFASEQACRDYLLKMRWPNGVFCKYFFPVFANFFPASPAGNCYVNFSLLSS